MPGTDQSRLREDGLWEIATALRTGLESLLEDTSLGEASVRIKATDPTTSTDAQVHDTSPRLKG